MLMWKNVRVSIVSVLYIYIYIDNNNNNKKSPYQYFFKMSVFVLIKKMFRVYILGFTILTLIIED